MSAYPADFPDWPLDARNAYFAQEAKTYDERKKANGKNHPASEDFDERSPPPNEGRGGSRSRASRSSLRPSRS
jgi:hypothetical protein